MLPTIILESFLYLYTISPSRGDGGKNERIFKEKGEDGRVKTTGG